MVWLKIDSLADASLSKYDTTIQEDLDLLEKDDQEKSLTQNERNSVILRSGEKKILHFLKDAAKDIRRLARFRQDTAKFEF